ncbi:hypothetical protein PHMEG_00024305, partial [Phytophthora megakarya]
INSFVHTPRRAALQPSPHSGSARNRTDSSRTITVRKHLHNSNAGISAVVHFCFLLGSTNNGAAPTGGSCKKSPVSKI